MAIIGGGAAGMMSAVVAARKGHQVTIIEQEGKLGRKLLSTGNGRCNFTNEVQNKECYHSSNPSFPFAVYEKFPLKETLNFFKEIGVYPKSRNGYIYPYSDQATAVVDVFAMELESLNVRILLNSRCDEIIINEEVSSSPSILGESANKKRIQEKKVKFLIKATLIDKEASNESFSESSNESSREIIADKIILTTGGRAAPILGSDGSGYQLAKSLGHRLIPVLPALVQLRCEESFYKQIAGLRMDGKVSIMAEDTDNIKNWKTVASDTGELQFTKYGLSGIPVFQVSAIAAKELSKRKKLKAVLDFMPHLSNSEVENLLFERMKHNPNKLMKDFFIGLFPKKMADLFLKRCALNPRDTIEKSVLRKMTGCIKEFETKIIGTNSFEQAQVCSGGVDTREVNPDTMESLLVKDVYFAGEILDVDGICGGYNLQWAWSSAYVAGSSLTLKSQTLVQKYRISQVKIPIDHDFSDIKNKIMKQFKLRSEEIISIDIFKKSIDARKKPELFYVYTLLVEVASEKQILKKLPNVELHKETTYQIPKAKKLMYRPVIVGTGPAGLFCGYLLAKAGCRPILLERGADIDKRILDVKSFWEGGKLNLNSNVQFGEGGAGTFSDGKLNTLVKDKWGRNRFVLETLVEFGAPKEILYEQKPHVGTDILALVVKNMRKFIVELGGEVLFNTQLVDISVESSIEQPANISVESSTEQPIDICAEKDSNYPRSTTSTIVKNIIKIETISTTSHTVKPVEFRGDNKNSETVSITSHTVKPVEFRGDNKNSICSPETKQEFYTDTLVLAIGHSARDTFEMLYNKNVQMSAKSFAVGLRIEHPQEMINQSQYGVGYPKILPAASYKLAEQLENGRGVYSFCMCPGGYVVDVSSEKEALSINGMSYHKRDGENANSAIVVTVTPDDFPSSHPLSGIEFQRTLERKAYAIGKGKVPVQKFGDFLENGTPIDSVKLRNLYNKELKPPITSQYLPFGHDKVFNIAPQIKGDWQYANLNELFPPEILDSIKNGILRMDKKIKGFANPDALLSGVESRTSSPVRIHRDENYESNIKGIYPCGEGAGYAGGITSAAMDGIKVAEAILRCDCKPRST